VPGVLQALQDMKVMPGTEEVAELLDTLGVPRGVVTRNVLESVDHFHAHVFHRSPFAPALARCFQPAKPSPAALLHICSQWGIPAHEAVMVGDSPKDDIVAGNRAGATTILIDTARQYDLAALPADQQPSFHVFSMEEVRDVLRTRLSLSAPGSASV
jgi:phosphoglycolate phosphatase-like HAD superfamily hydrolase